MGGLFKYARFNYDFAPAGTFGDAKIKEFAITIDSTGLGNNEIEFDACEYPFDQ